MKKWQDERDQSALSALAAKIERQFKPKTENQRRFLTALEKKTVIIGEGCAGVGKGHLACGFASRLLKEGKIARVVLTRPIVSCGQGYGFRPGSVMEKVLPVMRPLMDAMELFLGRAEVAKLIEQQVLEIIPLDDMRGLSLPNTLIICDEAQNAEYNQLHMLLTRFGLNSKMVLIGDTSNSQTDIKHTGESNPFKRVINNFSPAMDENIAIVRFTRKDIQRHPLLQWIDERMTLGVPRWLSCKCPKCSNVFWFDEKGEQEGLIVGCVWCGIAVDLIDDDGEFDPIEFHTKDVDLQSYKYDPGKVASAN